MQNRSAIGAFATLLAIACLYQLSFTWVANNVEKEAREVALSKVDSAKIADPALSATQEDSLAQVYESEYLIDQSAEPVYPLLGHTYRECKSRVINLGLDLQGGMNVMLEVSIADLIRVLSGHSSDPLFNQALKEAVAAQRDSQEDLVTLFGQRFDAVAAGNRLAAIFHSRENKDLFPREATNEEVIAIIRKEATDAVSRTEQVLRKRVDNLGVVQPNIQRIEGGRIMVELPGIKDKKRVRKILQGTAKLEFWETYENTEVYPGLERVNEYLRKQEELKSADEEDALAENAPDNVDEDAEDTEENGLGDLLGASSDSTEGKSELSELLGESDSLGSDSNSLDALADVRKKNPLFAVLGPIIVQDPSTQQYYPGKGPVVGYASLKDTAKVNAIFAQQEVKALLPPKLKLFWDAKPYDEKGQFIQLYAAKITTKNRQAPLEGDKVTNARVESDPLGRPEVALIMNADGARTWKLLTKENVGKSVAVVLDDLVYTAPTVQTEIANGISQISGNFTLQEAEDLAAVLKAGKLPAPSRIIEEAIVGPSLGAESISNGLNSFLIALAIILIYMVFYYAKAGAVADVALFANIFFVMGVLASLGATLTLPGIAGIVLTIGMSVDANVLIYERIREEVSEGKGIRLAIVDGYKNAYSSIIDANVTTLLTGIILSVFGTGPIKGFATTLIIGILTSLFSAIFLTRLIFDWQAGKGKDLSFATSLTKNAFKNIQLGFIKRRKLYYVLSGLVIILGVGSMVTRGFNTGVDFSGGRTYLVRFDQPVQVNQVADALEQQFVTEQGLALRPEVKTYGSAAQVKITTQYLIDDTKADVEQRIEDKLNTGLSSIGGGFELMSSQKVGPVIADDIRRAGVNSVIFSFIAIFLYILLRFKRWQYGLGALVAIVHDVLVVLGIFSLLYTVMPFSLEIDQAFIAAILTVVGYSINDTVVVFDRIREHLQRYKSQDRAQVINGALNSTLSRTINTSVSTFFVLLMIFIFGGEVIRGFVFALMVGVVVGTYSSLCVATPVVVDLDKQPKKKEKKRKAVPVA